MTHTSSDKGGIKLETADPENRFPATYAIVPPTQNFQNVFRPTYTLGTNPCWYHGASVDFITLRAALNE